MSLLSLVRRSILHYWQTNLAVVAGIAIAVAVLAGAMLVGVSVQASLRALALERLGAVDVVVTSARFVDESFADRVLATEQATTWFGGVVPIIAVEGFVTHQQSGRRASAIQVYGVDDRFWMFHGADPDEFTLNQDRVLVSEGLARELDVGVDDTLLVRVEKPSAVPISSLHGRRDDVGRTLRLGISRVLATAEHGEFSFRPQQGFARSVFVSLTRLQQEISQDGKVNTVLLAVSNTQRLGDSAARLGAAEVAVREVASLEDLGLRIRLIPSQGAFSVEAAAGLIGNGTADAVERTAEVVGLETQPVMTYLANEIRHGTRVTPYSLVTALDLSTLSERVAGSRSSTSGAIPVVLNDWTADDLQAEVGDRLVLVYYVWEEEGQLTTHEAELEVADVVPIAGVAGDPTLAPDYPGITEATDVGAWDPPFEIDLGLIRPLDEDYWDEHRTTPKAFISLAEGQQLWDSRWGSLTSIRMYPESDLNVTAEAFSGAFRSDLDPLEVGFVAYPARDLALEASSGATDFGLYFFYFSFFLVLSALLLASLFFRLGVEQRLSEIGVLRAVGFSPRAIWQVFTAEAAVVSVVGSAVGVLAAVAYAELIMWGLSTWWVDAVGTTRLSLAVSPLALAIGAGGGVLSALGSITVTLRSLAQASPRRLLTGVLAVDTEWSETQRRSKATPVAVLCFVFGLGLVAAAWIGFLGMTVGFFGGGLLLLSAMLAAAWAWLHGRPRRHTSGPWSISRVGFRNATARPGRSVLCIALIASAVFIIVAIDTFRREGGNNIGDPRSGTGGYALLADTLLPIAHDLSTSDGRAALIVSDLYEAGGALEGVTLTRFRVRPGEDASCLNLYQAKDPRILAPTEAFISAGRFSFSTSVAETIEEEANPWRLLNRQFDDGAIPAIADATSLRYVLHLAVGDDFVLNRDTERPIRLRIVAALADSIFQRELIIGERQFERVFPDYDGYRFFLVDAAAERTGPVTAALEDRLADFGLDVVSADERLASFHRVENTYLATFQTLGGLGLILGTLGLGAVLLRNVLERRRELALLRAVGYNAGHVSLMVLAENAFLLFAGLFAGTMCSLIAIAPAWLERGSGVPIVSLAGLLFSVVAAGLSASLAATIVAVRSPLLQALRTE